MEKIVDKNITKTLKKLEKQSHLEKTRKVDVSSEKRMLAITRDTGELINLLLFSKKAKNMLEIGTSTGYSTLWCAEVAKRNSGKVFTIEHDQNKIKRAEKNFSDAKVTKYISIKNGEAVDILESLKRKKKYHIFFDFVLIDADKENVTKYFDLVVPLVKKGGMIMTDNMTYPEKYRTHMKKLSRHIRKNSKFRTMTCQIGNGEEISVKI